MSKAICEDHEGMIWVGTNKGLNRLDPRTKIITRLLHVPSDPTTISNDQIRVIYEDKQETLWVGTGSAFGENYGTHHSMVDLIALTGKPELLRGTCMIRQIHKVWQTAG
jgi:ligand-binding sensor domain-containing protein